MSVLFKEDKVYLYRQDIISELQFLVERGHFTSGPNESKRSLSAVRRNVPLDDDHGQIFGDTNHQLSPNGVPEELSQQPFSRDGTSDDPDNELANERQCVVDCLLKNYFFRSEFDGEIFTFD